MSHSAHDALAQPADGHFVMIPLTRGKFAIVDEADAEMLLSMGKWYAAKRRGLFYANRSEGDRTIAMHVVVAGFERPDHVNRNGLDNRRVNLRAATQSQNNANISLPRHNRSGYKGVSWDQERRKWMAVISNGTGTKHLGRFDDPVEAARAYNIAALEKWGEYAWLNPVRTPCGTGWAAEARASRRVPVTLKGAPRAVFQALVMLGGEAATAEIRKVASREGNALSGRRTQGALLDLAGRRHPVIEQARRGHSGRGKSSTWRITPEGRNVVGSWPCSVGWPTSDQVPLPPEEIRARVSRITEYSAANESRALPTHGLAGEPNQDAPVGRGRSCKVTKEPSVTGSEREPKQTVSFRWDAPLLQAAKAHAESKGLTVSDVVRLAVSKYLEENSSDPSVAA